MGPEQEGLETLSQLPGDLGQFPKNGEREGVFCDKMLKQNENDLLVIGLLRTFIC